MLSFDRIGLELELLLIGYKIPRNGLFALLLLSYVKDDNEKQDKNCE